MAKRLVFLAGLPRSGSTLLSNILALHPQIHATPTSPLSFLLDRMRVLWSTEPGLLAQLDAGYDQVYRRLERSARAFLEAWASDTDHPITVDKGRLWLHMVETVRALYPDFRMIVCLRDLRDVYKSVEMQHRRTLLLTFPGPVEQNLVATRAAQLFSTSGIIGGPLKAIHNLNDIPDVRPNLYFWRFEHFLKDPRGVTEDLLRWMGAEPTSIPLERIEQKTAESDSHYHFKFPHRVSERLAAPSSFAGADLSPRILGEIVTLHAWYYRQFYRPDGEVRLERGGPDFPRRPLAGEAIPAEPDPTG